MKLHILGLSFFSIQRIVHSLYWLKNIPHININLYSVMWIFVLKIQKDLRIFVLKIQKDLSTRRKLIAWKPLMFWFGLVLWCLFKLNAIFNNISVVSWRSVLLVEETGIPGENYWPVVSHWQNWTHNVVSSTPRLGGIQSLNVGGDRHWLHR